MLLAIKVTQRWRSLAVFNSSQSLSQLVLQTTPHASRLKGSRGLTGSGCQMGEISMRSLTESLTSCSGDNASKSSGFIFAQIVGVSLLFCSLLFFSADCRGACCGSGWMLQAIDLNYTVCRRQTPQRFSRREGCVKEKGKTRRREKDKAHAIEKGK